MELKVEKLSEQEWASVKKEVGKKEKEKYMIWVDTNLGEENHKTKTYVFRDELAGYIKTDGHFHMIEERDEWSVLGGTTTWKFRGPVEWANEAYEFESAKIMKMRFKTTTTNGIGKNEHFPVTKEMVKQELEVEDEDIVLGVRQSKSEDILHARYATRENIDIDSCVLSVRGECEFLETTHEQCYYVKKEDDILKVSIDLKDIMKDLSEEWRMFSDEKSMKKEMERMRDSIREGYPEYSLSKHKKEDKWSSQEYVDMDDKHAVTYIGNERYKFSFDFKDEELVFHFTDMKTGETLTKETINIELKEWKDLSRYDVGRKMVEEWLDEKDMVGAKMLFVLTERSYSQHINIKKIDKVGIKEGRLEIEVEAETENSVQIEVSSVGYKENGKFYVDYIGKRFNSEDANERKEKIILF